jgi:hypothetical protein
VSHSKQGLEHLILSERDAMFPPYMIAFCLSAEAYCSEATLQFNRNYQQQFYGCVTANINVISPEIISCNIRRGVSSELLTPV